MKKLFLLIFSIILFFNGMSQDIKIEGHRGFRGKYPENTLIAFEEALKLGVQILEMDVVISKDKQVVVSHEPYMNSLFCIKPNGEGVSKQEMLDYNLYKMNYSEIKEFDSGSMGNPLFPDQIKTKTYKPLLKEVLALGEAYRKKTGKPIYYNIEIKSEEQEYGVSQPGNIEEFSDLVSKIIFENVDPSFIILQSFDFNVLKFWHTAIQNKHYPKVELSALVEDMSPEQTIEALGFLPDTFSPYYKLLDKSTIQNCHKLGMKVVPWTINEAELIKQYLNWGVDAVITDYPNRAKEFL